MKLFFGFLLLLLFCDGLHCYFESSPGKYLQHIQHRQPGYQPPLSTKRYLHIPEAPFSPQFVGYNNPKLPYYSRYLQQHTNVLQYPQQYHNPPPYSVQYTNHPLHPKQPNHQHYPQRLNQRYVPVISPFSHAKPLPHGQHFPHERPFLHSQLLPHPQRLPHKQPFLHSQPLPYPQRFPHAQPFLHSKPLPLPQPLPHSQPFPYTQPLLHSQPLPHPQPFPYAQNFLHSQPLPHPQSFPYAQPFLHPQPFLHSQPLPHPQPFPKSQHFLHVQPFPHAQPFSPYRPMYKQLPVEKQTYLIDFATKSSIPLTTSGPPSSEKPVSSKTNKLKYQMQNSTSEDSTTQTTINAQNNYHDLNSKSKSGLQNIKFKIPATSATSEYDDNTRYDVKELSLTQNY